MIKTRLLILCFLLVFLQVSNAQDYKINSTQQDSFSIALVQLLQCALNKFADCRGEQLRYTMMQEYEYKLNIHFPGSAAAIVRERDWDKNAYVEFSSFAGISDIRKGMAALKNAIRNALGKQFYEPYPQPGNKISAFYLAGISVRDEHGYYQSNIELMSGSSSDTFLISKTGSKGAKRNFILLKVIGGTPAYYHFIKKGILSPDTELSSSIEKMMKYAAKDFEPPLRPSSILKNKKIDTVNIGAFSFLVNRHMQNATAFIHFPVPIDSSGFNQQWEYYKQIVECTVGSNYVYHAYSLGGEKHIVYFCKKYNVKTPGVYLQAVTKEGRPFVQLSIRSNYGRPVKRSASID